MSQSEVRFLSPEIESHQKVTSFGLFSLKWVKTTSGRHPATSQEAPTPSNWFTSLFINLPSIHRCSLFPSLWTCLYLWRHIRQNSLKGTVMWHSLDRFHWLMSFNGSSFYCLGQIELPYFHPSMASVSTRFSLKLLHSHNVNPILWPEVTVGVRKCFLFCRF